MKKLLLILFLQAFVTGATFCQSFTIDDLMTLAYMPSKNIDHYMKRKGFILSASLSDNVTMTANFIPRVKRNVESTDVKRNVGLSIKDNSKYFTLHTSDLNEYLAGGRSLIKAGFFYDTLKDISKESSLLFQKANISIKATSTIVDGVIQYSFELKQKEIPSSVRYAEDLLQFDSHQFLVSFFGKENVKKDIYYLSENAVRKCSVLFSGTQRQVVFVWNNETYLSDLAYIMVSNALPTEGAKQNDPLSGNNEWKLKNGVCPGMALKDLLKINETDFDIYGNKSELAFLVKPNEYGKIDFKKTAVMLGCHECFDNKIFNQPIVSALDVAKANLPMRVFDVVIYPSHQ